jgi:hypothetical protein
MSRGTPDTRDGDLSQTAARVLNGDDKAKMIAEGQSAATAPTEAIKTGAAGKPQVPLAPERFAFDFLRSAVDATEALETNCSRASAELNELQSKAIAQVRRRRLISSRRSAERRWFLRPLRPTWSMPTVSENS